MTITLSSRAVLGIAALAAGLLAADYAFAQAAAPAAEAAPAAAAAAPKLDTGDTAWMLTSTALVLMMTIPGLGLFYGGMVRKKNVLATVMQTFAITCLVTVLWMIIGYSLAFTEGGMNAYLGGDEEVIWPAAGASTVCLLLNLGLLRHLAPGDAPDTR